MSYAIGFALGFAVGYLVVRYLMWREAWEEWRTPLISKNSFWADVINLLLHRRLYRERTES